jgi:hypothetical protein
MNKHTPGPWVLDSPDIDPTIDDSSGNCIIYGNYEGSLSAPVAADLVLAAAAPDLLEALEAWIAYHDDGEDGVDSMLRYAKAIDMTRDAIARARGEA